MTEAMLPWSSRAARVLGLSDAQVSDMPVADMRRIVEAKLGRPLSIRSWFPVIGRGNVMRDRFLSHAEVERQLSEALR